MREGRGRTWLLILRTMEGLASTSLRCWWWWGWAWGKEGAGHGCDPEDDERFGDEHLKEVGDGEDDGRVGDDQTEDQVMEDEELVETVGTPQSKSHGARITHVVRGPRLSSIFSNPPRVTRTVPELRRDSPSTKRKPTLDSPPRARKKAKEEEDLVKKPLPGSSVDVPIDVDNLQVSPRNICLRTCLQSITNPGRHSCHPWHRECPTSK